jgi:hypothetical protein
MSFTLKTIIISNYLYDCGLDAIKNYGTLNLENEFPLPHLIDLITKPGAKGLGEQLRSLQVNLISSPIKHT